MAALAPSASSCVAARHQAVAQPERCSISQCWRSRPPVVRQASSARRCTSHRRLRAAAADTESAIQGASTPAAVDIAQFAVQRDLPLGTLQVRPVQQGDVASASVLLTRAFAGSLQGVPISDARQYCQDCIDQPPRGVLLVARLQPTDAALLPPGQATRLVATTGLSFCRETREDFPTLQPPDDAVYLSNMSVDGKLRRNGLARVMLQHAEAVAAAAGWSTIYLHARLADAPAQQLYLSSGYEVVDKDNTLLAKVRGITPRALMRKQLL